MLLRHLPEYLSTLKCSKDAFSSRAHLSVPALGTGPSAPLLLHSPTSSLLLHLPQNPTQSQSSSPNPRLRTVGSSVWPAIEEEESPSWVQVGTIREHVSAGSCSLQLKCPSRRHSYRHRTNRGQMPPHKKGDDHFPENMQLQFAFYRNKSKPC